MKMNFNMKLKILIMGLVCLSYGCHAESWVNHQI